MRSNILPGFRSAVGAIALLGASAAFSAAQAVPTLQIYLEGGIYDNATETWVNTVTNGTTRLWVIGTPGNKGSITDAKLVAGYASGNGAGNVSINVASSTTGGYAGFTDPSTPATPSPLGEDATETSPLMNSGDTLKPPNLNMPPHDIYGVGTYFQEFDIGDFTLVDSPTGDFINGLPTGTLTDEAQINVYEITVTGLTEGAVHFDVYGTQAGKDVFAPFSHDGEAGGFDPNPNSDIPEPGTLAVFALGFLGLGITRRRRRR